MPNPTLMRYGPVANQLCIVFTSNLKFTNSEEMQDIETMSEGLSSEGDESEK